MMFQTWTVVVLSVLVLVIVSLSIAYAQANTDYKGYKAINDEMNNVISNQYGYLSPEEQDYETSRNISILESKQTKKTTLLVALNTFVVILVGMISFMIYEKVTGKRGLFLKM